MICQTSDCGMETSAEICTACVSDLQAWIDKALLMIPELDVTIARLDVTRPGNPETRNANHAGSAAPANLDALQLKVNMQTIDPDANKYATDPNAAGLAWLIQDWYTKAELLVSGPDEVRVITICKCGGNVTTTSPPPRPTDSNPDPVDTGKCQSCGISISMTKGATAQRIIDNAPGPMKSRAVVKWIRESGGHKIATTDIRNWAREGILKRANDPSEGHPTYKVQDVLRITYMKLSSGKGRKLAA